jgi:hypothetical protein
MKGAEVSTTQARTNIALKTGIAKEIENLYPEQVSHSQGRR